MSSHSRKLAAGRTMSAKSPVSVANRSTTTVNRSSRASAARSRACSGFEAAMLMFQQNSARLRSRVLEPRGEVHVADRLGHPGAAQLDAGQVVLVERRGCRRR